MFERCSPLDQLIQGIPPTDFSKDFVEHALNNNINVNSVIESFLEIIKIVNSKNYKKSFIEFLRIILNNPEILLWEKRKI
jgi:hypothetical protein